MKKYSNPTLEVVLFDSEEIMLTSVIPHQEGDYSANMLNEYFFGVQKNSAATTVQLQKISNVITYKR